MKQKVTDNIKTGIFYIKTVLVVIRVLFTVNRKIRISGLCEAFRKKITKRHYFKSFSGNFYRMVYAMEGSVLVVNGDEKLLIKSGEVAIRKEDDTSFIENAGNKLARILVMTFEIDGSLTEKLCANPQRLTENQLEKLNRVIRVLENCGASDEDFLQTPGASFLHELANESEMLLLCLAEVKEEHREEKIRLSSEFKEIVDLMRENVEKNLTVKDIAELCGMSESRLKKIFTKYSACSVHKYFLKMKIYKAIELLDNKYNVAEISEKLSFNNQSYFGVVFKNETGYSPLNYRKKFLHKG